MLHWFLILCGVLLSLLIVRAMLRAVRWYAHFAQSPAKHWRDDVLGLDKAARQQVASDRAKLQSAARGDAAQEKALADQALHSLLMGMPVEELDSYPGIGPATIGKLRDAGFANLADLQNANLKACGLGEKRLGDVKRAIRDLVKQATGRFQAGACPEAQNLERMIEHLHASASEEGYQARARLQAVEALLGQVGPLAVLARDITFAEFIYPNQLSVSLLAVISKPLPNLERVLQAADEEARLSYASRNGKAHADPPAVFGARPISAAQDLFREALTKGPAAVMEPAALHRQGVIVDADPVAAPGLENGKGETERQAYLAVLEIDPALSLSADLVRRQYNLLSERFAVEKFTNTGPEFVALAASKREAILVAATSLLGVFGEQVEAAKPAAAEPQEIRHNPDLDAVFGD